MIEVHGFRDGSPLEERLTLGDAERLIQDDRTFVWIDVTDPQREEIDALGAIFSLHPLTIEDAHHRHQRPKVELFEGYAFVVVHPLSMRAGDDGGELLDQELHAFVGPRYVATLRYGVEPFPLATVKHRWLGQSDLLAEAEGSELQERIFRLKREVVRLRRFAAPLRQALDLIQEEPRLTGSRLQPYYRDVSEHVIRVTELADNIRDLLTSLLEVRVSQVANRMNEITKKISAWAGIILVPTLIAGIYGMNFRNIPELGWRFGYPAALATMLGSAVILYRVFRRRGWL